MMLLLLQTGLILLCDWGNEFNTPRRSFVCNHDFESRHHRRQTNYSSKWVDETLNINEDDKERMKRNDVYPKAGLPWIAYKNFWWIPDNVKGEYCAVGIHGQVIYINRAANLVIVYFSSQPAAGSASSKNFLPKLNAAES